MNDIAILLQLIIASVHKPMIFDRLISVYAYGLAVQESVVWISDLWPGSIARHDCGVCDQPHSIRYPTRKFHEQVAEFLKEPENLPLANHFFIDDSGIVKVREVELFSQRGFSSNPLRSSDVQSSHGKLYKKNAPETTPQFDEVKFAVHQTQDAP